MVGRNLRWFKNRAIQAAGWLFTVALQQWPAGVGWCPLEPSHSVWWHRDTALGPLPLYHASNMWSKRRYHTCLVCVWHLMFQLLFCIMVRRFYNLWGDPRFLKRHRARHTAFAVTSTVLPVLCSAPPWPFRSYQFVLHLFIFLIQPPTPLPWQRTGRQSEYSKRPYQSAQWAERNSYLIFYKRHITLAILNIEMRGCKAKAQRPSRLAGEPGPPHARAASHRGLKVPGYFAQMRERVAGA